MRILRGKSNLEVSSNGFALFVLGLIFATFIGGAIRTLLSSDRVHQRILSEMRNRYPKDDIRVGSTEVLLSSGIWPGLGLKISQLSLKRENCGKLGVMLELPSVVLPISLWALRNGEVRLGHVELHRGRAHLSYKDCPPSPSASATVSTPTTQKTPVAEPEKSNWSPPRFDWRQLGRNIKSIELHDFAITFEREPTWKARILHAEMDLGGDFDGHAMVDLQKDLPMGSINHLLDIDAHGEESVVQVQVSSEFKEGRVTWKGSWDSSTQSAMSTFDFSQIPLKEVLNEAFQIGLLQNEVQIRSAWLSCQALWEGSIAEPGLEPVKFRGCKMEGAYGGVQMEQADWYPLQTDRLKQPIQFKVQNLQVQPMVEALNKQILPAVINRMGVWSGQFEYLNKNAWSLDGYLDGAEVVFSNQSVRGKQQLKRIHTVAQRVEGLVAAKIDSLEMSEGKFDGSIEVALSDDWKNGTFSVDIRNIAFSPTIQTLLTGGTWTELKLTGRGRLADGEVSEWKGLMESPKMVGVGWIGEKVVANSKFQPSSFIIDARIDQLELREGWRFYPEVREHLFANNDNLKWKDIRTKIEVKKTGGEIESFVAVDGRTGKAWRGRGNWQRERELIALLTGTVDGKQKNFAVRAEKGSLTMDEAPRAP